MNAAIKAYTLSECMDVMVEYLSSFERLGGETVVFCEDRLTLVAERALVKKIGGTFRSTVTTFARFLKAEGKTVSKQGSVMIVGEVMSCLQKENALKCFVSSAGIAKNAKNIYETIAQFAASEITPDLLREGAALLSEDTLKKKIIDLALVYEGYLERLSSKNYLDESRYLSLLPKRIREEGILKGKNVVFLGYASFTAQARETIRAALESAGNVVGIFCADDKELYANQAFNAFEKVCKEFGKVVVKDAGTPLGGEAEFLRRGVFNPERPIARMATENILLFEAEDKMAETEFVAAKIKRAMAENSSLRYRDIAVLVPAIDGYCLPLKKTFAEYGIPYFIDEKKSMKQHPLSRFVLDCFRAVKENYSPSATQALTGNYFFGESDEYRNYLYKFANYRGGAKRPIKTGEAVESSFSIAKLEDARERVLLATKNIRSRGHGRDYCQAIWQILQDFDVENKLKKLNDAIEDVAQKGYLSQIYRAMENLLLEAENLVGEREMEVGEFAAILEDGLDAMEISLIPLKADAVFIGDIAQSRIEKVAHLFALGLTDEVPYGAVDTAIVSDREIAKLAEVKTLLEPTVAEVNLRARESVCLNLCTFLDKLYLSYPLSMDGNEPSLSEIFRYVNALFCHPEGGDLSKRKKLSAEDLPYQCSAILPAVRQMLKEKADFSDGKIDNRKACVSIFDALGGAFQEGKWLFERRELAQTIERGEELFFRNGKISPTSLEGYFECPYAHFAERGLRLKEREESTVLAVDSGNFIHQLLEKTAMKAKQFDSEEELRRYAGEVGEELLKSSVYMLQQDRKAGEYSAEKLLLEGVDVAAAAYRQIKNSSFEVEETEAKVESALFSGKVDRIDGSKEYVRVIDYKTGEIDDSPTAYYTGRKIQMQLYMSEIMGERIPAGVFYFPASVNYGEEEGGRFRMKGFLNGVEEALKAGDNDLTEKRKSEYFSATFGGNVRQTKVMDESVFRDFIDYGVLVAEGGVKELKAGYVAPTPYDGHCKYCKYGGMCGFNDEECVERKKNAIYPTTIASLASAERARRKAEESARAEENGEKEE